MPQSTPEAKQSLLPRLGLFVTTTIVIGSVIGSGIFKKPAVMAQSVGSPEIIILIWIVAGVLTLFGALTNAEIASMYPRTGGQYVFFTKMYGDFVGFLYGWSIFTVIQTGSIASITYIFAEYTQYFIELPRFAPDIERGFRVALPYIGNIYPLENIGVKALTISAILFHSGVNYFGIVFGGRFAAFFTSLKIVLISAIIGCGFAFGTGSFDNFTTDLAGFSMSNPMLIGGIIAAFSAAFWAYDGWNNITYIAGEVIRPQKNIPRGLIIGTLVIITVYVLINLAYSYVLPIDEMATSSLVAADVAKRSIGAMGGAFIAAAVMISTFGTSNGTIMVSSRVFFAMAEDGLFFRTIGRVQPRFRTPANALLLQAVWASVLVLSGTFDLLTDMLIFVSWIFYALGAYGVFVLRKKYPDAERPYKVAGYPIIPMVFVVFATAFVFLTLYFDVTNYAEGKTEIVYSLFGLLLVAAGVPFYWFFKRRKPLSE